MEKSLGDRSGITTGNTNPGHWLNRGYFNIPGYGKVYYTTALRRGIPMYVSDLKQEHIEQLRILAH